MSQFLKKILIVDDDPKSLLAMEALLAGPGREIFKTESGVEALRYLLKHDLALILLDVRMPLMDGFETDTLIRQRERTKHTHIIFISAASILDTDVIQGFSSGAVDYIFKPIDPKKLKSKVALILDPFQQNADSAIK